MLGPMPSRLRKAIRLDVSSEERKSREKPAEISNLDFEAAAEVLQPPRKWRRKAGKEPLDLVV